MKRRAFLAALSAPLVGPAVRRTTLFVDRAQRADYTALVSHRQFCIAEIARIYGVPPHLIHLLPRKNGKTRFQAAILAYHDRTKGVNG